MSVGYSQPVNQRYYKLKSQEQADQKKLKVAEQYADSSLLVATNSNNYDSLIDAYQLLLIVHEAKKDWQKSLSDSKMILSYRDSSLQLKQRAASDELKIKQRQDNASYADEFSALRTMIAVLEQDKNASRANMYVVLSALSALTFIAVIIFIRKRRHISRLTQLIQIESHRFQSFKGTLSDLLASHLKASLSTFENLNKSLAHQLPKMSKEESLEFLKRLQLTASDLRFKMYNVVQWIEYQADTNDFNPVDIESKTLIRQIVDKARDEISHKSLVVDLFMPQGQVIFADCKMIETVLDNLLSNAIRYTSPGGTITFFAGRKDGLITLGIKDTGSGISQENISKVLAISDVSRVDLNGKGIGLALTKELIGRNGGRLYIESSEAGSTFSFSLPEGKALK